MEYIIGSLDDDGLLRKDSMTIADELAIYHGLDITEKQVDDVLHILQTFDPPRHPGAHTLQECLLLQIQRRPDDDMRRLMKRVVTDLSTSSQRNTGTRYAPRSASARTRQRLHDELRKLNRNQGIARRDGRTQRAADNTRLHHRHRRQRQHNIHTQHRQHTHTERLAVVRRHGGGIRGTLAASRCRDATSEALLYAKGEGVERAQNYIDAVKQRQPDSTITMQAIIDWQRKVLARRRGSRPLQAHDTKEHRRPHRTRHKHRLPCESNVIPC